MYNKNILVHKIDFKLPSDLKSMYTRTLTDGTMKSYIQTIKEFYNVDDLSEVTANMIKNTTIESVNLYAEKEIRDGVAAATVNKKLSALKNFFDFLCRKDIQLLDYNPADAKEGAVRFKNASKSYSDKRVLTSEEINLMLKQIGTLDSEMTLRDTIALKLLATTGMRRSELIKIKLKDLKINQGLHIAEIKGKGEKYRIVVIANDIYSLIERYITIRGADFSDKELPLIASCGNRGDKSKSMNSMTVYRIVKKYAELAGIDPDTISPHCLRATVATTSYDTLGMHVDRIQEMLGHSSQATTQRYIKTAKMVTESPAIALSQMIDNGY